MKIHYPEHIQFQNEQLSLQGKVEVNTMFIKLYSGSLYASQKFTHTSDIISVECNKLIRQYPMTHLFNTQFIIAQIKRVYNLTEFGQLPEVQADIDSLIASLQPYKFKKKDQLDVGYSPSKGITFSLNDNIFFKNGNPTFAKATLELYFGSFHHDKRFSHELAGLKVPST